MSNEVKSKESDRAKEERLREKLKKKAEELKCKDESNKGLPPTTSSSTSSAPPDLSKKVVEDDTKNSRKKIGAESSTTSKSNSNQNSKSNPGRNNNRRRNRRQRPDHRGGHGRGFDNGGGGHGYRPDPYGRSDWRGNHAGNSNHGNLPPAPHYDYPYRRNGYGRHDARQGHGNFHGHNQGHGGGAHGGYDNRAEYWREGPYRHPHDRSGRDHGHGGPHGRNHRSPRSDFRNDASKRLDTARNERGRSRSRTFSRSRTRSNSDRSYSNSSYSSRSSNSDSSTSTARSGRSVSKSRDRSRSRSLSSDRSVSRSVSRSRSTSRSPENRKRSRSESDDVDGDHGSDRSVSESNRKKKSRSRSLEEEEEEVVDQKANALTKDQRTIFVSQLVMKTQERDIQRFFRKIVRCKVNDVQLLRDKRTGRHKGCAYVELGRVEDVPRAVKVSGTTPEFQRFPILIKASEAEKNYGMEGTGIAAGSVDLSAYMSGSSSVVVDVPSSGVRKRVEAQKVYVGSIDRNVTQAQLYAIFSQFGELEKVVLQVDTSSGMSKGYAFLQFKCPKVANLAIEAMSGQVLAGRPLRTGWANLNTSVPNLEEVSSTEFPVDAIARIEKVNETFTKLNRTGLAPLPRLNLITGTQQGATDDLAKGLDALPAKVAPTAIADAAEEAINAAFAMPDGTGGANKIEHQGAVAEIPLSPPTLKQVDDPHKVSGEPSNIILVHNMFDKDEETEQGWEEDIKLDFEEESSKHGRILSVKVMSEEVGGKIFASFETKVGAKSCAENLAGRWFDKRQLRVEFVSKERFEEM